MRVRQQTHVAGVEAIELAFDKIIDQARPKAARPWQCTAHAVQCSDSLPLHSGAQKLNERKKVKGIKLDKKKKDDVVVSLGPIDKIRCASLPLSLSPRRVS